MQALFVTVAGMVLLFLALGILMLFMNITARLLPVREEPEEAAEPAEEPEAEAAPRTSDLGGVIAAAAVALALAERDAGFAPVAPLSGGAGADPWVILGRQAQMLARQPR
jgi:sodium pump decarboxylase gamma subunit